MTSSTSDFEFDADDLQLSEQDLQAMDDEFLKSIQQKTEDASTAESNNAFTFWFLIVLLLVFVFFLAMGAMMFQRGRRRRLQYMEVGYRE